MDFVKRFNATTGVVYRDSWLSLRNVSLILCPLCRLRLTIGAIMQTPIMI